MESFESLWAQAIQRIEGQLNLDGQPLPEPDAPVRQRLDQALRLFEAAARLAPENAGPWLLAGKVHERLGNAAASLDCLRKAHALVPDEISVIIELSTALGRNGLHGEAVPLLARASAMYPSDPRMYCNLGLALLMSGEAKRAVMAFENLVLLEPGNRDNARLLGLANDVASGIKPAPRTEEEAARLL